MAEKLKRFKIGCNKCGSLDVYYNGNTKEMNILCNNCGIAESLTLEPTEDEE